MQPRLRNRWLFLKKRPAEERRLDVGGAAGSPRGCAWHHHLQGPQSPALLRDLWIPELAAGIAVENEAPSPAGEFCLERPSLLVGAARPVEGFRNRSRIGQQLGSLVVVGPAGTRGNRRVSADRSAASYTAWCTPGSCTAARWMLAQHPEGPRASQVPSLRRPARAC